MPPSKEVPPPKDQEPGEPSPRPAPIGGPPKGKPTRADKSAPAGGGSVAPSTTESTDSSVVSTLTGEDRRQIEEIRDLLLVRRSSELVDLLTFLKSRRSLAWSNFVMGMSRGIGFFLGFTLVGALIVALVGFFVDWTAETFSSNYSTRSIVRSVMGKYEEVMDEVAQVQGERAADHVSVLPSASGAHLGAVFAQAEGD